MVHIKSSVTRTIHKGDNLNLVALCKANCIFVQVNTGWVPAFKLQAWIKLPYSLNISRKKIFADFKKFLTHHESFILENFRLKIITCDTYVWLVPYSDVLLQYYKFIGFDESLKILPQIILLKEIWLNLKNILPWNI